MVALRPKTFWIAVTPVLVGISVALAETGRFDWLVALLTLTGSVLMQVITNLQNDVGYTTRRAERSNRTGLPRATSHGWLTVAQVRVAMVIAVLVAMAAGLPLIWLGGWPILAMGLGSIAAAYLYMGGPKPIAYTPLGELAVLIFFGLVAVGGSFFLQTGFISSMALLAGTALGLLAAAVLAVNNFRDRAHDAEIGRFTLAVALGKRGFERVYAGMLLLPFVLVAWVALEDLYRLPLLIVLAVLPAALGLTRALKRSEGLQFNAVLFATVRLETLFGLLLTAGALVEAGLRWT